MTGPQHYRQAESLVTEYLSIVDNGGDPGDMVALAQVHATLALAAANALPQQRVLTLAEYRAWYAAVGEPAPEGGVQA